VPLSKQRERWRGYNQALELSKSFCDKTKLPLCSDNLVRVKNTVCQAKSQSQERYTNVLNAFTCLNQLEIKNKSILLVDDVITTGATMEECAKVLKRFGTKEVVFLAIARSEIGDY
jgi:ComF family protein